MSRFVISSVVVGIVLAGAVGAQETKDAAVTPAPVPAQIISGKRVFISNAGEENLNTAIGPLLSGGADRVYNQFYAAIRTWGRYELVPAPAEADLVFEIGFTINGSGQLPEIGHLRLAIRDPKTNVLLWTFIEYAQVAIRKGNRDKNLDHAMGVIVDEIKDLTQPGAPAKP
jgi:hypothetical protein